MQTNYLGHYLLTHKLLPLLIASGRPSKPSRIVFVASEAHYACPTFAFENINNPDTLLSYSQQYGLSKFLSISHTMFLAEQLKHDNVMVHAVCPGMTITEFWDRFPSSSKAFAEFLQNWFSIGRSVFDAASNVILGKSHFCNIF
jgi:NAD(P)-dependent dehydrogenase (short-subunit alcohol dehydrogenase family)